MANQFIKNKYTKWYFEIVHQAQSRKTTGYFERHHVVPKCLGGTDDEENLVNLSAREHFVVHLLLTKMLNEGEHHRKVCFAFNMMLKNKHGDRYKPTSRFYEHARLMLRRAMTGRVVSDVTRKRIGDAHRGKRVTDESRAKMARAKTGRTVLITEEHAQKISTALKGKPKTAAHRDALARAKLGKPGVARTKEWKEKIATAQRKRWERQREKSAH